MSEELGRTPIGHYLFNCQAPDAGLELSPQLMRGLSVSFIQNLVEIHAVDYAAAGLGELGQADGYVMRQIAGWTKRYYAARTDAMPEVERLASWLAGNAPPDSGRVLIHNDFKYDNVLLAPADLSQIVAVLDWEMATIGDPLMDFGTTLGYWVDADDPPEWQRLGFGLTALPGSFSRRALVEHYARQSGRDVGAVVFYYADGLLKIAVIVQQIYQPFQQGFTQDARFADLGQLIRACGRRAGRAIELGRIEHLD